MWLVSKFSYILKCNQSILLGTTMLVNLAAIYTVPYLTVQVASFRYETNHSHNTS